MTLAVSGALQFTELASLLIAVPFLDFSNTDKKNVLFNFEKSS